MLHKKIQTVERLSGGRNSRVYKLKCENIDIQYIGKHYLSETTDRRDRLNVEYMSLQFLWSNDIRVIPKPIAVDPTNGIAIYEYIEGTDIDPQKIDKTDIAQAVQFLELLKNLTGKKGSEQLPDASEASFTINDIYRNLELRVDNLLSIDNNNLLQLFLYDEFLPVYNQILTKIKTLEHRFISFDLPLQVNEKTLSPSDYGFHNAIKDKNGKIYFLDFEYFGWDDPAKTICDFILHPAMQLQKPLKEYFLQMILPVFEDIKNIEARVNLVFPLYVLKWCVILLNEFIPERLKRRSFAIDSNLDIKQVQSEQLRKARKMLKKVVNVDEQIPYG